MAQSPNDRSVRPSFPIRTPPPPEWREARVARTLAPPPIERRAGRFAEEAMAHVRIEEARRNKTAGVRPLATRLSRSLVSEQRSIKQAIGLAQLALRGGEDPELRAELSQWLEETGDAERAAAALRPMVEPADARSRNDLLVRAGRLYARAENVMFAAAAFEEAASALPDDPTSVELLALLHAYQDTPNGEKASQCFADAARRHRLRGQIDGELLCLRAALEHNPVDVLVVERLVVGLEGRATFAALDEVWRRHLDVVRGEAERMSVLRHREALAQRARDPLMFFCAALDTGPIGPRDGNFRSILNSAFESVGLPSIARSWPDRTPASSVEAAWMYSFWRKDSLAMAAAAETLAGVIDPAPASILLAHAARLVASAQGALATRLVDRALELDPTHPYVLGAWATLGTTLQRDSSLLMFEHLVGELGSYGPWCDKLGRIAREHGRSGAAIQWFRKALAQGAKRGVLEQLALSVADATEVDGVAGCVDWVVTLPLSYQDLAPLALSVVRSHRLGASWEGLSRKMQRAVGSPRFDVSLELAREAAKRGMDGLLLYAVARAVGADAARMRDPEYFELAYAGRLHTGDATGAAHLVVEAMREGCVVDRLAERVKHLFERGVRPDGELSLLEARAIYWEREGDARAASQMLRDLGAAQWDLAEDSRGAIRTWLRAARLSPLRGYCTLAGDLSRFVDSHAACHELLQLAEQASEGRERGALLAEASRICMAIGDPTRAYDLSRDAIMAHPGYADAIQIAEEAALQSGTVDRLFELYDLIDQKSLGPFNRRATNYRAARYFEKHGLTRLSAEHAARAFVAVPSDGSAYQMLVRLAAQTGRPFLLVGAIEQVAERAASRPIGGTDRAGWLLRAAEALGSDAESLVRKVDILLRALVCRADVGIVRLLGAAASELSKVAPEESLGIRMRLSRVARSLGSSMEGPDAARLAIAFARLFLEVDADPPEESPGLVVKALELDADVDEYTELLPHVGRLAEAGDADFGDLLLQQVDRPFANIGVPAYRLIARILGKLGRKSDASRIAVGGSIRHLDDDTLRIEADLCLADAGEDAPELDRRHPRSERARQLLEWGLQHEATEEPARVLLSWRRARDLASDTPDLVERVTMHLRRMDADDEPTSSFLSHLSESHGGPEPLPATDSRDELLLVAIEAQARGDFDTSAQVFRRILDQNPRDDEANTGLDMALTHAERFDELAEHLANRAAALVGSVDDRDALKALRLRRAVLLEQRLGRVADARQELRALLSVDAESPTAVRYLATLEERAGEHATAGPLWQRSAMLDPSSAWELELRAARAFYKAGEHRDALQAVGRAIEHSPDSVDALELGMDAARALSDYERIGAFAELLVRLPTTEPSTRARLLVEAAEAALRIGDGALALIRAQKAARAAPSLAEAQLLARSLEYRLRGPGDAEDAERTEQELGHIFGELDKAKQELLAFLRAEAADVLHGAGAGMAVLRQAEEALGGAEGLVSVGIAERLPSDAEPATRVDYLRRAASGNLQELWSRGRTLLALAAAEASAGDLLAAGATLRAAVAEPDAAHGARLELFHLAVAKRDLAEMEEHGRVLASLCRTDAEVDKLADALERAAHAERELSVPAAESVVMSILSMLPLDTPGRTRIVERLVSVSVAAPNRPAVAAAAPARPSDAAPRDRPRSMPPSASLGGGVDEKELWDALDAGDISAADALLDRLAGAVDRTADILRLRYLQADAVPGDLDRLKRLFDAAHADGNAAHAAAVGHVLGCFEPACAPVQPPLLEDQPVAPGLLTLLLRPEDELVTSVFEQLWEGAMPLFAADPGTVVEAGLEKVPPGSATPLARLYANALHLLDLPKIPLHVARTNGPHTSQPLLSSPAAVILAGDVDEDTPSLRHALGRGIASTLSRNVLLLGLTPKDARILQSALLFAFGPPELGRSLERDAVRLAESFWQVIPARVQRRLQELLASAVFPPYDENVERATQSTRRVGLFVAGDFRVAAEDYLGELRIADTVLSARGGLKDLCARLPGLADLYRLAISPPYAAARFQPKGASRSTNASSRWRML